MPESIPVVMSELGDLIHRDHVTVSGKRALLKILKRLRTGMKKLLLQLAIHSKVLVQALLYLLVLWHLMAQS